MRARSDFLDSFENAVRANACSAPMLIDKLTGFSGKMTSALDDVYSESINHYLDDEYLREKVSKI